MSSFRLILLISTRSPVLCVIPKYCLGKKVVSTTATAFFTVPQTLLWDDFNLSSNRLPGWSQTRGSSTISLLCLGTNSTGFPFASGSNSRSWSSSATPSMFEVWLTSAAPVILSGRSTPCRVHLRSAVRGDQTVPRIKTRRFGPWSFLVSGPVVWNSLPEDIRIPELSLERFKSMLKTHLFRQSICLAALTALSWLG